MQEGNSLWGATGKERTDLRAFAKAFSRMNDNQRKLLLVTAAWMARRKV
jgi:hypothetical protein